MSFATELQELLDSYGVPHAGAITQIHFDANEDHDVTHVTTIDPDDPALVFVRSAVRSHQQREGFADEWTPVYDDTIYHWDGKGDPSIRERFGHIHNASGDCIKRRNRLPCSILVTGSWEVA